MIAALFLGAHPFGWYVALDNHSRIHAFFTHRGMPVALGIVTAACWLAVLAGRRRAGSQAPANQAASLR